MISTGSPQHATRHTTPNARAPRAALTGLVTLLMTCLAWPSVAAGQAIPPGPPPLNRGQDISDELEKAKITQKLEAQIPLDATFVDSEGNTVQLRKYFDGDKPIILNFGYFDCPGLCKMVWGGMEQAFSEMSWTLGDQYEVVTISFDPGETPEQAAEIKTRYGRRLGEPVERGWHFLTGGPGEIERVTEAVGFGFTPVQQKSEFAHEAALIIMSPEGKVMQYRPGMKYKPFDLRMSMMDASEGKTGSVIDMIAQYCAVLDPNTGSYVLGMNVMRAGGALSVVALAVGICIMVRIGRRRRRRLANEQAG